MNRKRQFTGVAKPRLFFDRKVQRTSTTRILSMGKVLPKDWEYVRLIPEYMDASTIMLRIEKLALVKNLAPNTKNNKSSKQVTPTIRATGGN